MGTLKYYINGVSLVRLCSFGVRLFLTRSFFVNLVFIGKVLLGSVNKKNDMPRKDKTSYLERLYFSDESIIYGILSFLRGRGVD